MDAEALHAAQAIRWREVDPLLPAPTTPGPPSLVTGHGAGWVQHHVVDPDSAGASWGALRRHVLTAHVGGPNPDTELGTLLDLFADEITADPGDDDAAAELQWPARDTVPVLALARRGYAPTVATAVRVTGGSTAADVPGVRVRPLSGDDVDAATALNLEIVRYDHRFGSVTERPSSAPSLAADLEANADRDRPTAWVAEQDGRVVGLCAVEPPAAAAWIAPLSATGPAGYLATMIVGPAARGGGVGAALHARADAALKEAGAAVTLLHHAVANPLSAPFWHRNGYRPLWLRWQRRPAVGLS